MNRTTRIVLIHGVVAGLVVAVPMVALMITLTAETAPDNGALYGYLTMIVALTAVFLGVKQYRDNVLGGVVRFMPALLVGLAISAVASGIYALGWEISLALTGFDFPAAYMREMLDGDVLHVSSQARELGIQIVMRPPVPLAARPLLELANFITVGLLPSRIRHQYGFGWDPLRQVAFEALARAHRTAAPVIPASVRRGSPVTDCAICSGSVIGGPP